MPCPSVLSVELVAFLCWVRHHGVFGVDRRL